MARPNARCDICTRPGRTRLVDVAYRCRNCLRSNPRISDQTYISDLIPTLHASYRQVDYWIRSDYVAPRLKDLGSGHQRGVTAAEVAEIQFFDTLVAFGILPARVAEIIAHLGDEDTTEFVDAGVTITVERPQELAS